MNTFPLILIPGLFLLSCGVDPQSEPDAPKGSITETVKPAGTRNDPIVARGYVRKLENDFVTIEHGDIPDFMSAMTMPYPVSEPNLLETIEIGAEITFSIEILNDGYQIFSLESVSKKDGNSAVGGHDQGEID